MTSIREVFIIQSLNIINKLIINLAEKNYIEELSLPQRCNLTRMKGRDREDVSQYVQLKISSGQTQQNRLSTYTGPGRLCNQGKQNNCN